MIFRKESVEATFAFDEKTDLRCIAKNIDEAKKMAEEHSGKKLVLTGWKIVLGRKDRETILLVNKSCYAPKKTRVVVHQQKN